MSGPTNPRLSALWAVDPHAAAAEIAAAIDSSGNIEEAAKLLHVGRRTLYRWLALRQTLLTLQKGSEVKPRELRGAINRARTVYALCQYATSQAFYVKVSKEAAKEIADAAQGKNVDVVANEDGGELFVGYLPTGDKPPPKAAPTKPGSADAEE